MNRRKILIQTLNPKTFDIRWEHLCYVPSDVHRDFFKAFHHQKIQVFLERWLKEDFPDQKFTISNKAGIRVAKEAVIQLKMTDFEMISKDNIFNSWITHKMKKELEKENGNKRGDEQ